MNLRTKRKIAQIESIRWDLFSPEDQAWIFRAMLSSGKKLQQLQDIEGEVSYLAHSKGYCHCCCTVSDFSSTDVWLRDHFVCHNCGSSPRERNFVRTLDELIPAWKNKIIHESSPSVSGGSFSTLDNYSASYFLPERSLGEIISPSCTVQNLEKLTFEDDSFDLFFTQDVMEHVFNPQRAFNEILRVIKPGGWHIFSTLRHVTQRCSKQRAKLVGGSVIHIKEPIYHGNPVDDKGALVTYDWGRDFEKLVYKWTGCELKTFNKSDSSRGIAGAMFETFAMQKNA
ncbi:class I SAM-dependent methyltransferase [Vibrio barjaei]|uniref:class I SAM-dependent methyltransferase n=1 Tax=Vibrio barjaei TaxID=1676683 RepID=UPI002284F11D|nr:class I SAM-dependent methyltransferase [Vibrio barjaei]MCY9872551.1 class I SAM-dependent methyltransferase [Vibrio barjaei]